MTSRTDSNRIGSRGENIFAVLITNPCGGRFWFDEVYLGEKAETADFLVRLVEPSSGYGIFYVQVKSSAGHYVGKGSSRKLRRTVSASDINKLKRYEAPVYVVGVDTESEEGFLMGVTASSERMNGIPTYHRLDCGTIERLWNEVNDYWSCDARKRRRKTQFH